MFIAFVALLLLVSVPLTGGWLGALGRLRLRRQPLLIGALLLQVLITDVVPDGAHGLLVGTHLATYAMAAVFLWANRRLPGLLLVALGGGSNALVIGLNHGTLPATAGALARAGIAPKAGDFTNSGVLAHPVLAPLGDIMATPAWLPFRNVLSIGDLVALAGTAVLLHAVCRTRPTAWVEEGLRRALSPLRDTRPGSQREASPAATDSRHIAATSTVTPVGSAPASTSTTSTARTAG